MRTRPDPPVATHDPLFDDAWLKWGWAVHRGVTLDAEIVRGNDLNLERLGFKSAHKDTSP
jgi:hypothetical protein